MMLSLRYRVLTYLINRHSELIEVHADDLDDTISVELVNEE